MSLIASLLRVALYAAYGSNMDPAQMLQRCPHSPQRGTGWLEGWRLSFGGEDLGWDGDATEAECFAYLGVRSVLGLPLSLPTTTGVPKPVTGGVLVRVLP